MLLSNMCHRKSSQRRRLPPSTNNAEELPLVDFATPSPPSADIDRSLLQRLLSCKPCRKITERKKKQTVRFFDCV